MPVRPALYAYVSLLIVQLLIVHLTHSRYAISEGQGPAAVAASCFGTVCAPRHSLGACHL